MVLRDRCITVRARSLCFGIVAVAAFLLCLPAESRSQEPFLSYDFSDGLLTDFILPSGLDECSFDLVLPLTPPEVVGGAVEMINDGFFGIALMGFDADVVAANFPQDYKARLKFNFVDTNQVTQFSVSLRGRSDTDLETLTIDNSLERSYSFSVTAAGVTSANGGLSIVEFTSCHEILPHPEWPGADVLGQNEFAAVETDFPIEPGEDYWLEVVSHGDDVTGPVVLTASVWEDGAVPPDTPQIVVLDESGLCSNAGTVDPNNKSGVAFGTNLDVTPRPLGARMRFDDLSLSAPAGCPQPPTIVTRLFTSWEGTTMAQGENVTIFEFDSPYDVDLEFTEIRTAGGGCDAAGNLSVVEVVPSTWAIDGGSITGGGVVDGNTITWDIDLASTSSVRYRVTSPFEGSGLASATFQGYSNEMDSDYYPFAGGGRTVVAAESTNPVSDFGTIQHWLMLGPYLQSYGAGPSESQARRDFMTDGVEDQYSVRPKPQDTIATDFDVARSDGLACDANGHNAGGLPTWVAWVDLDDDGDLIDFEDVYGALDDIVVYALTYIDVEEETVVNFAVSKDDAIYVTLDGVKLHYSVGSCCGQGDRRYQLKPTDDPMLGNVTLTVGQHVLMLKVFERGGEHHFRFGFIDDEGNPIPGGPDGVTISLPPPPPPGLEILRGDANDDDNVDISDASYGLNFLFLGGPGLPCNAQGDANDDGTVDISDSSYLLNFLFLGGPMPPAPFPVCAAIDDPKVFELGCETAGCPSM